jgi:hypothetical protein
MIRVTLLALLLAASPAAFAQLYKCVDAKGKTQYSDKPLPGCKAATVKGVPPPPPAAKAEPKGRPKDGFEQRHQIAREQAARCAQARQAVKRGDGSDAARETLRDCM